ncbi:sensor histidine kinase [Alkalicoccobacillus murimartini]|uniref:histidine kinase n=1 Tax=Alkalicoccobacillus murimartini TaxID=171685 RepID=A0ABT9YLQ2_9BACI|nr:sensor histidine kinase [Alkalicoccobacillus murimartini]MDQ0208807.1 two-component system sensor histidine kinase DesK [Alkalicoccobacillus murimartini]
MLNKMQKLNLHTYSGISPYIWAVFFILPFYYIFQFSFEVDMIASVILTVSFFVFYRIAFLSKGWLLYLCTFILMGVSTSTIFLFGYTFFAFFIAYFIGNIRNKRSFYLLYFIHLGTTSFSINYGIINEPNLFVPQLAFVIIAWISVILLPFSTHNKNERDILEDKLEDANEQLSELIKIKERQRIARDLHDTLGQSLSMIGLKSELARKLIYKDPQQAVIEIKEVQQTARTSLNEVRKLVSSMRGLRLKDERTLSAQLLKAAHIAWGWHEEDKDVLTNVNLITENILAMCLKEAITNVVKHSNATTCEVYIQSKNDELVMIVRDNGTFKAQENYLEKGNGLAGMKERLEFVNGSLAVDTTEGTELSIQVPYDIKIIYKDGNS